MNPGDAYYPPKVVDPHTQTKLKEQRQAFDQLRELEDGPLSACHKPDPMGWGRICGLPYGHQGPHSNTAAESDRCPDCGAPWNPVRRGECSKCGSDAGPGPSHEHEWGPWHVSNSRRLEPGDVTRSRWCTCGAYEMWTKNDPVTTSRDLSYRVEVPGDE